MAQIELKQVEKRFGDFQAVQPMDLTIQNGEFVVLLGPSGCGKTTTLRMISGLEAVTGGKIFIGDQDVTWHNPDDRDIAFVFQLYALYPHMTVEKNITFPLEAQKESKEVIQRRLRHVVDLLQIRHLLPLKPGNLSGGDKQRVALGRALVRKPSAFLMDEPLGALDADFRETMRAEIKKLHIAEGATTVYVTHDQVEAMAMGDRIVVMSNAVVQQVGTPDEVYYDPSNLFVARFWTRLPSNVAGGAPDEGTHVSLSALEWPAYRNPEKYPFLSQSTVGVYERAQPVGKRRAVSGARRLQAPRESGAQGRGRLGRSLATASATTASADRGPETPDPKRATERQRGSRVEALHSRVLVGAEDRTRASRAPAPTAPRVVAIT